MYKYFITIIGISGALAVSLGAFGAHGLKAVLSSAQLATFQTGNDYHFYHTFTLLAVGILAYIKPHPLLNWVFGCFLIGIIAFSGSLYLLATKEVLGIENWSFLGPITPIGGLFFIIGWVLLALYGWKVAKQKE